VPDELYGAARMLKAAGVDQFSLPERLQAMPSAQRDHFSRLYAVQASVIERHLDDLAFVTGRLRQPSRRRAGWVTALEDALLPRLPLSPEELTALTLPVVGEPDEAGRLAEIRDGTPFALTSQLAAVAAIRRGHPRTEANAVQVARALRSPDRAVQTEAALALADWRYTALQPFAVQPGDLRDVLLQLYLETTRSAVREREADRAEAGLGLALLAWHYANVQSVPIPDELLRPLLHSGRPDLAFGAAVVLGDREGLQAALRVPERRTLAAVALGRLGQVASIAPVLPLLSVDDQARVLSSLHRTVKDGADAQSTLLPLREVLLTLLKPYQTRSEAARFLLLIGRPEDALPLVEADPSLASKVLQHLDLSVQQTEELCARLLDLGQFRLSALPAVTSGQISDTFVPEMFWRVQGDAQQELLTLARLQLGARADPGLHRFVWSLVEGDVPDQTRARAWNVLAGWYGDYGHELRFSLEGAGRFFGGVGPLVERLCTVLERPDLLAGLFTSYDFLKLLDQPDQAVLASVRAVADSGRLKRALTGLAFREDGFVAHRAGAVQLLGQLASSEEEQLALSRLLLPFLDLDAPWQLQRAALAALYPTRQKKAAQLAELRGKKAEARTYDEAAPLDALIYQLDRLAAEADH